MLDAKEAKKCTAAKWGGQIISIRNIQICADGYVRATRDTFAGEQRIWLRLCDLLPPNAQAKRTCLKGNTMTPEELAKRLISLSMPLTGKEWEGLLSILEIIQPGITVCLNIDGKA